MLQQEVVMWCQAADSRKQVHSSDVDLQQGTTGGQIDSGTVGTNNRFFIYQFRILTGIGIKFQYRYLIGIILVSDQ
jgi:hypothetical protein